MKKLICILFISGFTHPANAQKYIDVTSVESPLGQGLYYTINGEPFVSNKFSKVTEGSPYLNAEFIKGSIILSGGRPYHNIPLKINILEGTILYMNQKNQELESTVPIRKVIIPDAQTGKARTFVHSDFTCSRPQKTWYELLDSGSAVLLKHDKRIMKENKPYGSATTEQIIHSRIEYILMYNKQCTVFKTKKEFEQMLKVSDPTFTIPANNDGNKGKGEELFIEWIQSFNNHRNAGR